MGLQNRPDQSNWTDVSTQSALLCQKRLSDRGSRLWPVWNVGTGRMSWGNAYITLRRSCARFISQREGRCDRVSVWKNWLRSIHWTPKDLNNCEERQGFIYRLQMCVLEIWQAEKIWRSLLVETLLEWRSKPSTMGALVLFFTFESYNIILGVVVDSIAFASNTILVLNSLKDNLCKIFAECFGQVVFKWIEHIALAFWFISHPKMDFHIPKSFTSATWSSLEY